MSKPTTLTPFQQKMLLSICPPGSRIVEACYFRREYLPCPVRVVVRGSDGSTRTLVLRMARHGDVQQEARLLPILAGMNLPVPQVLAGPARDGDAPGNPAIAVYSLLPGINLQELSQRSAQDCRLAGRLVIEAARQLASLTSKLRAMPQAGFVPTITLRDQLRGVLNKDDAWLREGAFRAAIEKLQRVLDDASRETVFTSGDYQPGNFLTDGTHVTGFVDFEMARCQDFLFGFAKYPIYDLHPLNKGGFVAFLLEQEQIAPRDFDVRLALGCLMTLQREIPVTGGDADYREHVLRLLAAACRSL